MFILDWRLAVFSLALVPVFVGLTRRVGRERKRITATRQESMADIATLVQESLSVSGILLGKTMGRSAELAERFEDESAHLAEIEVRQRMAGRWVMASIQMSFAIMPAAVYWFAGQTFIGSAVTIGTVVAFTTLQTRLFWPVGSLLNVQIDIHTSLALFDRVFEYMDLDVDIEESDDPRTLRAEQGQVEFSQVSFRYESEVENAAADATSAESAWTLRDVSFVAQAGTTTAVVGETGSGKTSLGYLVARLYDPTEGAVRIDDVDLREVSFDDLSDAVGVVSQETYLFHATVRENLRFARPDASDREIEAAARAAHVHDVINRLPAGYETLVGERGYRFSGGEKQRMAIARTVLRNPPILVLDEARQALSTPRQRGPFRRRWTVSRQAVRRSQSHTGFRRFEMPTRSSFSSAERSLSAALTTSCWPSKGAMRRWSGETWTRLRCSLVNAASRRPEHHTEQPDHGLWS